VFVDQTSRRAIEDSNLARISKLTIEANARDGTQLVRSFVREVGETPSPISTKAYTKVDK
jgi:hypothetical protein